MAINEPIPRVGTSTVTPAYDLQRIRREFPILATRMNDHPLVYLDNASTTQKPRSVIEALQHYYEHDNANIHRGVYSISVRATQAYEATRRKLQHMINAALPEELIFTRGTTEAINLVAHSWGRSNLKPGDEILVTELEHHSNIVPWQLACEHTGAALRVAGIDDRGDVKLDDFRRLLGSGRVRMAAFAHISNALGTVNPVREMVALAHEHGALALIDGAQAMAHGGVDVREIDVDFYAFSGHKMYGPTGIGGLYGRKALLECMPPWQGGGDMIESVSFERTTYAQLPAKFEAGTPSIAAGVAFGSTVDFLNAISYAAIDAHEAELLDYGTQVLSDFPQVRLIGTAREKASVLSFVIDGVHPHDAGTILDQLGIAVRTGHHCAQPVMQRFGVPATIRASLGLYNTTDEIDALAAGVRKVCEVFGV
jgi:cysteine desulfurase/selenocysteine lyase